METTTTMEDAGGISPPSESSTIMHKIGAVTGVQTPNLPEEIVIEILARLPVTSLLKFRHVSKSWRSIISTPSFAKYHVEASLNGSSSFTNHRLMLKGKGVYPLKGVCPYGLLQSPLRFVMEEGEAPLIDVVSIDFPGTQPKFTGVLGSHNGLLCVYTREEKEKEGLLLWNPVTKVHFYLPYIDFNCYTATGFGYSSSNEDYKVVIIFNMLATGGVSESVVKIYSHKSNSWKLMEPYNYNHMYPAPYVDSGKLVNGKLHFVMSPNAENVWWDIVYIDLDSETDGIIEQPDYGKGPFNPNDSSIALGVLGGSLCILYTGCDKQGICNMDLWVLKEYAVKESWAKLLTIHCIGEVRNFWYWNPLFMLPTGKILLERGRKLAVYNPRCNTWNYLKFRDVQSHGCAVIHVESLVSPLLNAS